MMSQSSWEILHSRQNKLPGSRLWMPRLPLHTQRVARTTATVQRRIAEQLLHQLSQAVLEKPAGRLIMTQRSSDSSRTRTALGGSRLQQVHRHMLHPRRMCLVALTSQRASGRRMALPLTRSLSRRLPMPLPRQAGAPYLQRSRWSWTS